MVFQIQGWETGMFVFSLQNMRYSRKRWIWIRTQCFVGGLNAFPLPVSISFLTAFWPESGGGVEWAGGEWWWGRQFRPRRDWCHQHMLYLIPPPQSDPPTQINEDLCKLYCWSELTHCDYWGLTWGKVINVPLPEKTSRSRNSPLVGCSRACPGGTALAWRM